MNEVTFLKSWGLALVCLGVVVGVLGAISAPMAIPLLLDETWWSFALMGLALFVVISFLAGLATWVMHRDVHNTGTKPEEP